MAAIDKMYLNDWYSFDHLVRWSICHFPTLLNYFYDWRMTHNDWADAEREYVESVRKINKRDLEKIGGKDVSLRDATYNFIDYYRKEADYECSYEQVMDEVKYILDIANKDDLELADNHSRPVLNTPIKIDKKLLWICPVPEVREYLYEQCGYKRRWEWFYRIFWRGKKEFGENWWKR